VFTFYFFINPLSKKSLQVVSLLLPTVVALVDCKKPGRCHFLLFIVIYSRNLCFCNILLQSIRNFLCFCTSILFKYRSVLLLVDCRYLLISHSIFCCHSASSKLEYDLENRADRGFLDHQHFCCDLLCVLGNISIL